MCRIFYTSFCLNKFRRSGQVIFQLRWSDIFVKTKVILKPSVSVILYLPLNCAKHNITRRKPNITAQQYNLPQANITEKTTCRNKSFFLARLTGIDADFSSALPRFARSPLHHDEQSCTPSFATLSRQKRNEVLSYRRFNTIQNKK